METKIHRFFCYPTKEFLKILFLFINVCEIWHHITNIYSTKIWQN